MRPCSLCGRGLDLYLLIEGIESEERLSAVSLLVVGIGLWYPTCPSLASLQSCTWAPGMNGAPDTLRIHSLRVFGSGCFDEFAVLKQDFPLAHVTLERW